VILRGLCYFLFFGCSYYLEFVLSGLISLNSYCVANFTGVLLFISFFFVFIVILGLGLPSSFYSKKDDLCEIVDRYIYGLHISRLFVPLSYFINFLLLLVFITIAIISFAFSYSFLLLDGDFLSYFSRFSRESAFFQLPNICNMNRDNKSIVAKQY
jgi:hypothetical protein